MWTVRQKKSELSIKTWSLNVALVLFSRLLSKTGFCLFIWGCSSLSISKCRLLFEKSHAHSQVIEGLGEWSSPKSLKNIIIRLQHDSGQHWIQEPETKFQLKIWTKLSLYSPTNKYSSVCASLNDFIFILMPYGLENRSFSFEENHLQTATVHNWMCEKKCSVKSQRRNYLSLLFIYALVYIWLLLNRIVLLRLHWMSFFVPLPPI